MILKHLAETRPILPLTTKFNATMDINAHLLHALCSLNYVEVRNVYGHSGISIQTRSPKIDAESCKNHAIEIEKSLSGVIDSLEIPGLQCKPDMSWILVPRADVDFHLDFPEGLSETDFNQALRQAIERKTKELMAQNTLKQDREIPAAPNAREIDVMSQNAVLLELLLRKERVPVEKILVSHEARQMSIHCGEWRNASQHGPFKNNSEYVDSQRDEIQNILNETGYDGAYIPEENIGATFFLLGNIYGENALSDPEFGEALKRTVLKKMGVSSDETLEREAEFGQTLAL